MSKQGTRTPRYAVEHYSRAERWGVVDRHIGHGGRYRIDTYPTEFEAHMRCAVLNAEHDDARDKQDADGII